MEKIFIGSDHAGFELKEKIRKYLLDKGYEVFDEGNLVLDNQDDYPDFANKVVKKVLENNARGILICGSGAGMCIVANKNKGIRAVNAFSEEFVKASRQEDDVNVLCLGQRFIDENLAIKIVKTWLETNFSGEERHKRRIGKIDKI